MFVRVIVLLYSNTEQGNGGIFSKRENSLFSGLKWTTVKLYNLPNYFGCDCRLALLFTGKIADFPTLFKTEFRFLIPCLRHLTQNHTLCKTIINIESLSYLIHYFGNHKTIYSLINRVTQAVYRPRKDTLFKTKIDKIDTLIKTKLIKSFSV